MTVRGDIAPVGQPARAQRLSAWWIGRLVVLVAFVLAAGSNWQDHGGSSAYSTGVAIGASATVIATLFVLINGPQPRWATRWAWFWLIMNPALVVTVPLFLIGSGPLRPTDGPVAPIGKRLTGGWAFFLAFFVLGGATLRL